MEAISRLADLAIVSFAVDPGIVAPLLDAGFVPETFTAAETGTEFALVSAVSFRTAGLTHRVFPGLRLCYGQVNYRAYVRHGAEHGVWFFGASLDSPIALGARIFWQAPWYWETVRVGARRRAAGYEEYRLEARGAWGAAEAELHGLGRPPEVLDGFEEVDAGCRLLTHPTTGYSRRRDGRVAALSVAHEPLAPEAGFARRARFAPLERLGLVAPGAVPHSVLLIREALFTARLPPRVL